MCQGRTSTSWPREPGRSVTRPQVPSARPRGGRANRHSDLGGPPASSCAGQPRRPGEESLSWRLRPRAARIPSANRWRRAWAPSTRRLAGAAVRVLRKVPSQSAGGSRGHAFADRQATQTARTPTGIRSTRARTGTRGHQAPRDTAAPAGRHTSTSRAHRHATRRRPHRPGTDLEHQNNAHPQGRGRQRIDPPSAFPQVNTTDEAISRSTRDTPLSHATSDHASPKPRIVALTCRFVEPPVGIEPTTYALRGRRATAQNALASTDRTP
jgi:hypothetical protein